MNNQSMLEFLMENDVVIFCPDTGYSITADEAFELGGEFVVYDGYRGDSDLYRGLDFTRAMRTLEGKSE